MLISVSDHDPKPIYEQIITQIKEQARTGEIRPGDELPSVRELGESLGINLHTVHRAYQKLRDQGIIHLRLGQRAKVAAPRTRPASPEAIETALTSKLRELITDAYHLGLSNEDFKNLVDELLRDDGGK